MCQREIKHLGNILVPYHLLHPREGRPAIENHHAQQIVDQDAYKGGGESNDKTGQIFDPKHFPFRRSRIQKNIISTP